MQELARYWSRDYDWRRCEARLNALPNFLTELVRGGHFAAWEQPQLFSEELAPRSGRPYLSPVRATRVKQIAAGGLDVG